MFRLNGHVGGIPAQGVYWFSDKIKIGAEESTANLTEGEYFHMVLLSNMHDHTE